MQFQVHYVCSPLEVEILALRTLWNWNSMLEEAMTMPLHDCNYETDMPVSVQLFIYSNSSHEQLIFDDFQ